MARTDPAHTVRIGAEWDEADRIAARISEITGQRVSTTEYVRRALAKANAHWGEIVDAPEVEVRGGIIDVGPDGCDIGGGVVLRGPGVWRLRGTLEVIRIEDHAAEQAAADLDADVAAAMD